MDVTLPNGTVIRGVPETATREQVMQRAIAAGLASPEDFGLAPPPEFSAEAEVLASEEQPTQRGPLRRVADIGLEGMAAVNRGAAQTADFLTTVPVNALLEVAGSDRRVPAITDLLAGGTAGGFMDEGLGRDVVRGAGELVGPGALAGQVVRTGAQRLPQMGQASESVRRGALRQMGGSAPGQDVGYSALSGAGAAVGGDRGAALGGDTGEMVGQTLGGILAPVAGGLRPMRGAQQVDVPRRLPAEADALAASQATGVDVFPAQRAMDPQQLRAQQFLPELTPAAQRASVALERQNRQAATAVDDFVRAIAPDDAAVTAGARFRSASQRALEAARDVRAQKANPLYKKAIEQAAPVNPKPINDALAGIVQRYPESGTVSRAARRVMNMMNQTETTVVGSSGSLKRVSAGQRPSLSKLHHVKLEIDEMLSKVGEHSLGNTAKRELVGVKKILLNQMEEASPAYRQARQTFEAASPPVNQLEESIIGKIADFDDTQLKNISRRIFDPAESDTSVVRQAKRVIDDVDPDAWNRLLRAEVQRRLGGMKAGPGSSQENVPAKLRNSLFGNQKSRAVLLEGMTPAQRQNAELLDTALSRAAAGRPGGSPTAGRQQFIRELDGGVVSTVRNFLRNPLDRAIGLGESRAFDRRAEALADVLFDPAWTAETTRALKDRSGKSFGYLLYRAADLAESLGETEGQTEESPMPGRALTASEELPELQMQ